MSDVKNNHCAQSSVIWGARPCSEENDKYPLKPDLLSYEELLCQLSKHFKDIDLRFREQSVSGEPDLSYEEQWTGRWDRTDSDGPRKIYVKTFDCGQIPSNGRISTPTGVENLKTAIEVKGTLVKPGEYICHLPYINSSLSPRFYTRKIISKTSPLRNWSSTRPTTPLTRWWPMFRLVTRGARPIF